MSTKSTSFCFFRNLLEFQMFLIVIYVFILFIKSQTIASAVLTNSPASVSFKTVAMIHMKNINMLNDTSEILGKFGF